MSTEDFTTENYVRLLDLAKTQYKFISYSEIALGERFILWRHDCDFSLNRSLRLAQLEHEAGVRATYFLNPHSEFYHLLEKKQAEIVRQIVALGHDIGLHFDAAYYDVDSEDTLDALVVREARLLRDTFEQEIHAFSFHNPTNFLLACEAERYGGLLNCYSAMFKQHIPYCSDSNGYWRHRRLEDVLRPGEDPCLQVLTHPAWWQEQVMRPRERIQRCIDGRAATQIEDYDAFLEKHGRRNFGRGA
jgi:hypothetical protein